MKPVTLNVCEAVGRGHPDKIADQISDAVLDELLDQTAANGQPVARVRAAVETLVCGRSVVLAGEVTAPEGCYLPGRMQALVRDICRKSGVDDHVVADLDIRNLIRPQSPEIAAMTDEGAGDQGIMVGFATRETPHGIPLATMLARGLIARADHLAASGGLPWLRFDTKSQVVIGPDGKAESVVLALQHRADISLPDLRSQAMEAIIRPVMGDVDPKVVKINAKGSFILGGAEADAGVTGRKIVCDSYAPGIPVGGGAFSGKDASKVDRTAAYMARFMALTVLAEYPRPVESCQVSIAFGIGQLQPEMLRAMTGDAGGEAVTAWLRDRFPDLSPRAMQAELGLWDRNGWCYVDTAALGHFGRGAFPWEAPARQL